MSQFTGKETYFAVKHALEALKGYREYPHVLGKNGLYIVSEGYRYDEGSVSVFLDYDGKIKGTASE
jgi:hypothetical protein